MSKETRTYFPNYQLRESKDVSERSFVYENACFTTKIPLFGATNAQKEALIWATYNTPPVVCLKHGAVQDSDMEPFYDPLELHRYYSPYSMVVVELECLGEKVPRKIKLYFCDIELHQVNSSINIHSRSKGTYIVPVV